MHISFDWLPKTTRDDLIDFWCATAIILPILIIIYKYIFIRFLTIPMPFLAREDHDSYFAKDLTMARGSIWVFWSLVLPIARFKNSCFSGQHWEKLCYNRKSLSVYPLFIQEISKLWKQLEWSGRWDLLEDSKWRRQKWNLSVFKGNLRSEGSLNPWTSKE